MESIGVMKMTTGDGSPLRQGAEIGSRLVFGGYRGLRRRNSRSRLCSGSLGIYKRCWHREQVREVFLPGQIFLFGSFALRANSLGHLEQIDSYAPGHQISFGNLDYVADV